MRVLALVTDAFGGYGGIAQYNRDFVTALSRSPRISEITVLPRIGEATSSELPEKVHQLPPVEPKAEYIISAYRVAKRQKPFDLLFCGHINAVPLCILIAASVRVPTWLQVHGIDAWECRSRSIRFGVERSTLITAVSRYTRHRVLEWANIDANRVRVLPNTVRPFFSPGQPSEAILEKYELSGKKIILTVSRLTKADQYKGHAETIRALAEIRERFPDAVYVIAGDGDGRANLDNLVSKLRLQSRVRFVGRISDEDVLALYRSSTVFIMPSTKEGFGIVFVEAAAVGLPVIGGNRDGSVDALADGRIGRAINPRSINEIIASLAEALEGRGNSNPAEVGRFCFENFATHVHELVGTISH